MSSCDTYKIMKVAKFMTKNELIEMRDEIENDRTWGAILTGAMIGGLGFINTIAAILSFTVGVGVGMKTSFARGADDRIQDILDDNDCEDGMYVVLKAEGHFNIPGTELKEITYLDVLSAVTPDEIGALAEWV